MFARAKQTGGRGFRIAARAARTVGAWAFLRSRRGATAIEYALIIALVSVGSIGALSALGTSLLEIFGTVNSEFTEAVRRCVEVGSNCQK